MNELPPDPPRLRAILRYLDEQVAATETVGIYLRLQRDTVRKALAKAEAPRQQPTPPPRPARQPQPAQPPTGYIVEKQIREGHPLGATIHVADCTMPQRQTRPVSADDARTALSKDAKFFHGCEFCQPGKALGMDG